MSVGAPVIGGTRKYAAWPRNFRPVPADFGAMFQTLHRAIGTGGVALTEAVVDSAETALFNAKVPAAEQRFLVVKFEGHADHGEGVLSGLLGRAEKSL